MQIQLLDADTENTDTEQQKIPIRVAIPEGIDREVLQGEFEGIAEGIQTRLTDMLTELGMAGVAARLTIELVETEQG